MYIPKLNPRLYKIAQLIPNCNTLADIGTDHAYLPVFLVSNGICKKAIASDIAEGPLKRANNTVVSAGLSDKICLRKGEGLCTLSEKEADAVCIAGMGGLLISKILNDGISKLKAADTIILQPMSAVSELREFLYSNGWIIKHEYLVKDTDKLYNILSVALPDGRIIEYNNLDLLVGKNLINDRSEHFNEYLKKIITKTNKKITGLERSSSCDLSELKNLRKIYNDLLDLERN